MNSNCLVGIYFRNVGYTVYPNKYAHGFVVLCFVVVMQSFMMNSHEVFIHIHQGCFAGTGAIVRLPQCQWSKPDGYGKISQCITTTKHSKAKTVCIFLGIYCTWFRQLIEWIIPNKSFTVSSCLDGIFILNSRSTLSSALLTTGHHYLTSQSRDNVWRTRNQMETQNLVTCRLFWYFVGFENKCLYKYPFFYDIPPIYMISRVSTYTCTCITSLVKFRPLDCVTYNRKSMYH